MITFEEQLPIIEAILKERKAMPASKEGIIYRQVKYFFKKFQEKPEVERLKYIYATSHSYPIPNSKFGKRPKVVWEYYDAIVFSGTLHLYSEWEAWRDDVVYEYITYVFERFGETPAENSAPMKVLKRKVSQFYRYNGRINKDEKCKLITFSKSMAELGCNSIEVTGPYLCKKFEEEDIQFRVREMMIKHGACAVKFIADTAIPGIPIPAQYVYYYYYYKSYDKNCFWEIFPLGRLYLAGDDYDYIEKKILFVHYRDYHKCNIPEIRKNAQLNFRNWDEVPPESLKDWIAYAQCNFFILDEKNKKTDKISINSFDWNETIVGDSMNRSLPYFSFYPRVKYIDFYLYLLENNYPVHKNQGYFKDVMENKNIPFKEHQAEEIRNRFFELLSQKKLDD